MVAIAKIEGGGTASGYDEPFSSEQQANTAFIAAANPAVVLELLAERDADKKRIAELEHEKGYRGEGWRPDTDPITGSKFFMWIAHPDKGMVPTYGGPYDSYTLAERDKDGSYWVERYDHDMGCWRGQDMGIEDCGVRVVDDQLYVSEEDPDDLKAEITELRAKIAPPVAWSGWACQFPGHMPRLYGDKAIAEINCDYDGGAQLLFLSSIPPAPAYPERLPCPVRLMPGLLFGKGVPTESMLDALKRREEYEAELEAMTPAQRGENDARLEKLKALIPQPAPAAAGELLEAMEEVIRISDRDHEAWDKAKAAISACRAAMLAQPVSSGYTLPDGWIACSERMPDADGAYWCWFGKEKSSVIQQRVCIWNDRNHEWCDSAVTHWMPLPAAPEGGNG